MNLQDLCAMIVRDAMPATDSGATCFVPRYQIDQLREALSAPQPPSGGEVTESELIALIAGPYNWHHKMNELQEREAKGFDRCRELTIQNIRTWFATRRAMHASAPPSAPVGVFPECEPPIGYRVEQHASGNWLYAFGDHASADYWPSRTRAVFKAWEHRERQLLRLARQSAAEVYVDFPQVGTAGPFHVVDGRVTLPEATMNDLIRHARTGYVEQPAAVDGAMARLRTHRNWRLWNSDLVGGAISLDRMRAILEVALAAQPGGSDDDR